MTPRVSMKVKSELNDWIAHRATSYRDCEFAWEMVEALTVAIRAEAQAEAANMRKETADVVLPPNNEMLMNALRQQAMVKYVDILERREEILSAFIAKYGLQPDEIEMVEERTDTGLRWYVKASPAAAIRYARKSL